MNRLVKAAIVMSCIGILHSPCITAKGVIPASGPIQTTKPFLVNGIVTDTDGHPVEYANVAIIHATDSTIVTATSTDSIGTFHATLFPGCYVARITCLGYKPRITNVAVPAQSILDNTLNIGTMALETDGVVLGTVSVSANRPTIRRNATGFLVTVANARNLQDKTIDRILNFSPGVFVDRDGGITINGRSGVTVVVNDKTMRISGKQLMSYLKSIQGSELDNIEIICNPTAAYDASSAGGVIRINTRRQRTGVTGYVSADFGYDNSPHNTDAIGIYYGIGPVTLYGSYDFAYDRSHDRYNVTQWLHDGTTRIQSRPDTTTSNSHSYRIGLDWQIAANHSLGLEYNGLSQFHQSSGTATTDILAPSSGIASPVEGFTSLPIAHGRIVTSGNSSNHPRNNMVNLDYTWHIDTLGQRLKIIADYSNLGERVGQYSHKGNRYYDVDGNLVGSLTKRQSQQETIDILSAQTDYETRFGGKTWKLSAGAKYANITTDYRNSMFDLPGGNGCPATEDIRFRDHFNYRENIAALYVMVSYVHSLIEGNVGLRGEYTAARATSHITSSVTDNDYFRLFPSLFLYYKPITNHGFMLYYGMRTRRPPYYMVNPFTSYISDLEQVSGNPSIRPEIINSIELTYVFKDRYFASIRASLTDNRWRDYSYISPEGVTVKTFSNIGTQNSYYFEAYVPIDRGIWTGYVVADIGMTDFSYRQRRYQNLMCVVENHNYLQFTDNFGLQANLRYLPPFRDNVFIRSNPHHTVKWDMSLDLSLAKGKLMLNAGVDDILDSTRRRKATSLYDDYSSQSSYYPGAGRLIRVGVKYNFSSGRKVQRRDKSVSNADEMRRVN